MGLTLRKCPGRARVGTGDRWVSDCFSPLNEVGRCGKRWRRFARIGYEIYTQGMEREWSTAGVNKQGHSGQIWSPKAKNGFYISK